MTWHERYDTILDGMLDAVRERYGERLAACAVYGSVGRGAMRGDFDVDSLVVAPALPPGRFVRSSRFDGPGRRLYRIVPPPASGRVRRAQPRPERPAAAPGVSTG